MISAPAQPPAPTPETAAETAPQGCLIHFPITFFAVTMGLGGHTAALHAAGGPLGFPEICWLFFSAGLIFLGGLLRRVCSRRVFHDPLPGRLQPTLVILIGPPPSATSARSGLTRGQWAAFWCGACGRARW